MTDRELLERAAKVAGIEGGYSVAEACFLLRRQNAWGRNIWDPLNDDGDALRLAVKLRMLVDCEDDSENPERYAAVRRAIVLAAASADSSEVLIRNGAHDAVVAGRRYVVHIVDGEPTQVDVGVIPRGRLCSRPYNRLVWRADRDQRRSKAVHEAIKHVTGGAR